MQKKHSGFLFLLFFILIPFLLFGQENPSNFVNFLGLFKLGGIFMYPLLLFSILTLGVILEKLFVFFKSGFFLPPKNFYCQIITFIKKQEIQKALDFCDKSKKSIENKILKHSLLSLNLGLKEFEKQLESTTYFYLHFLEKRLHILSILGNLAPLTGFLGTVSGMIAAFKKIALANQISVQLVASGIYEALVTTAAGLIIALFALGFYNFFVYKIDKFLKNLEGVSYQITQIYSKEKLS